MSLIVGITGSPLAGITLFVGCSGVLSLTLLFFPPRPEIAVTLRGEENAATEAGEIGLIIGATQTVRLLDVETIVTEEEQKALETMPRMPTPQVPPGKFGGAFDLSSQSTVNMIASISGASDEELRAFVGKVRAYGDNLRAWLEQLRASRQEHLRVFSVVARASEEGQAPADFARVRLRFPSTFVEPDRPPQVPEPPERPKFVGRLGPIVPRPFPVVPPVRRGALSHLIPRPDEFRGISADYSSEDGLTIVDLNIGHINQDDHRDTAEFTLRAAPPGLYEIGWRISANSLNPPTEGTIKIEVREPIRGEPIVTLEDALAERENHSLD